MYLNGYDVKGSPFMMRVGTQRRSKSGSSPNSTYRQSPIHSRSSPNQNRSSPNARSSPIHQARSSPIHAQSSPIHVRTSPSYVRQSPSPVLLDTHKYAQDYHQRNVEKRVNSSFTTYAERNGGSPRRSPAPNRPQSPLRRSQSPDYITSKKLNERRFETSSPSFGNNYTTALNTSYNAKMSNLRVSDSPVYERKSPEVGGYSSSRYDRKVTESRTYTSGFDEVDGVDTSPIMKVSGLGERAAGRRDSWDAIAKTRNILSNRSLESVANLTDQQLDEKRRQNYGPQSYVVGQSYNSSSNQNYVQKSYDSNYGQAYKSQKINGGASSVRVQPIPDGILGQPVEFESKYQQVLRVWTLSIHVYFAGVVVFFCNFA